MSALFSISQNFEKKLIRGDFDSFPLNFNIILDFLFLPNIAIGFRFSGSVVNRNIRFEVQKSDPSSIEILATRGPPYIWEACLGV